MNFATMTLEELNAYSDRIKKAERKRLDMIVRANQSGDNASYQRAINSFVNDKGKIIFFEDIKKEEKVLTQTEKLDQEIQALEFDLLRQENMAFLPKDFYKNQDRLIELKRIKGEA